MSRDPGTPTGGYPGPLLQPDNKSCGYYASAYVARALGFDTSPDDVRRYAVEEQGYKGEESHLSSCALYLTAKLPLKVEAPWPWMNDPGHAEYSRFWLGPANLDWFAVKLIGRVALAVVYRKPNTCHMVAVLGAGVNDVLLMDPLFGFRYESWDWFLGSGPGTPSAHWVEGFYERRTA